MRRRKLLYGLGASGAVFVPSGLTAAAYNSFTVERDVNISVQGDDTNGILGLSPGTSKVVDQDSDGALRIDISEAFGQNVDGVNVDSELVVGDETADFSSNPGKAAFTVRNNDSTNHTFDVAYVLDDNDPDTSTENVTFEFYDTNSTNNPVATVTESESESNPTQIDLPSSGSKYVVLTVDTNGLRGEQGNDSGDSLSGVLRFELAN
jgi:hypothetical protein